MTCRAIVVEAAGHMIWIRGIAKVGLVAAKTIAAQSFELAVLVAEETIGRQVGTGQGERGIRMVEGRRFPSAHGVTRGAIVRKLTELVIGALDIAKVRRVT
jgi:hypothetical protein